MPANHGSLSECPPRVGGRELLTLSPRPLMMNSHGVFSYLGWLELVGRNRSQEIHSPHNAQQSADVRTHIPPSQNGPTTGTEEEERIEKV